MNILVLSLYYHPDRAANAAIITQLTQTLAHQGHRVRVVCAMPHYDTNAIWPSFRGRLFQRDEHDGVQIVRVWLHVPADKTNLLGRIWNYISFNILSTLAGLTGPRPDVILAPSPPLTIGLSAWLLGLLRRAPYVYNVQDIYPDVAVRLGALTNRRVIAFFSRLERFIYRHARAITVLSQGFRRNLLDKGVPEDKLSVIPNFVDTALIRPGAKDNALSRREGLLDRFVVLFAGNMGHAQAMGQVLEAAALLHDHRDILFLLVGNGTARPDLESEAAERRLGNVRFLPYMALEEMPDLHAAADLCLVPLRRGVALDCVPSKALTICAAGRPMVAAVDPDSDIEHFVRGAGAGLCVPPEDPQAMAEAIQTLYRSPERRQEMGRRGRAHVLAHHTPEAAAQAYHNLFERILARRRGAPEEEGQPYMGA